MTDLDLGMNDHVTEPLVWDDNREYDRGKVLSTKELDQIGTGKVMSAVIDASARTNGSGSDSLADVTSELDGQANGDHSPSQPLEQFKGKFGRYLDVDDDGIPYRTIPGTHPSTGAFVTRGSSRDEYAVYTEDGEAYRRNVDRLARKWNTAKELVPGPQFYQHDNASKNGVLFFGTSTFAAEEAIELLTEEGITMDVMRVRAFPFGKAFRAFVEIHERIFVIEQNRDAQFKSLMMIELGVDPHKLVSVLNYDGTPITADNILKQIKSNL